MHCETYAQSYHTGASMFLSKSSFTSQTDELVKSGKMVVHMTTVAAGMYDDGDVSFSYLHYSDADGSIIRITN